MINSLLIILAFVIALPTDTGGRKGGTYQSETAREVSQDHGTWILHSLEEIETVRVGMTRGDLLKVFTGDGGLSTALRRTYVYRSCPYIKVDVQFRAVGRPDRDAEGRVTTIESEADEIIKISRPYLARPIAD
jgi:hypothetical protein